MKILLATYFIVPHVGGVWNYMGQLKQKLESLGHKVDLLGSGTNHTSVHIVNENRRVEKENLLPLISSKLKEVENGPYYADPVVKHYEFQRCMYKLAVKHLGLEKYDLIHTQDVISSAWINEVRPKGTPLVATLHGSVAHELKDYVTRVRVTPTSHLACKYFDRLEHEGASAPEFTIVANNWLKNILVNEFYVPAEKFKVFHYGYDIETFLKRMEEKSSIQPPKDKKVIIYTGRLTELKGVHYLISALGQLKRMRNDWVCWIVGEGDKYTWLKARSEKLGLESEVEFLGKRDDVPYLLSISDIFVFPSLLENQPLSVIEAQIARKPVIVSDVGGLPEIVEHDVTGIITPARDVKSLCQQINYLLTHEKYRETLGSNAQKWGLVHWSLDNAVKSILEVYQSAISKKE